MLENTYLPLGSIVLLREGKKRLMIYGRKLRDPSTMNEYDYIGCLYPEGNIESDTGFLFNHEQIYKVYFLGLQDKEEENFRKNVLMK